MTTLVKKDGKELSAGSEEENDKDPQRIEDCRSAKPRKKPRKKKPQAGGGNKTNRVEVFCARCQFVNPRRERFRAGWTWGASISSRSRFQPRKLVEKSCEQTAGVVLGKTKKRTR